jgi:hypothetical protein
VNDRLPMSLAKAAKKLGYVGSPRYIARQLKRSIVAKERRIKKQIMLRTGSEGTGARYEVTMWALQKHMPELFPRRDELVERLQKVIAVLNDRIDRHEKIIHHLGRLVGAKLRDGELQEVTGS